jgi:hypothetical protein
MRITTSSTRKVSLALVMFAALAGTAQVQKPGQQNHSQMPHNQNVPGFPDRNDTIGMPDKVTDQQTKVRNDDRQKRLVADSNKLLELATQLHNDVAKTDKNILSIDVVHRAEEIERLARSVKERMKG